MEVRCGRFAYIFYLHWIINIPAVCIQIISNIYYLNFTPCLLKFHILMFHILNFMTTTPKFKLSATQGIPVNSFITRVYSFIGRWCVHIEWKSKLDGWQALSVMFIVKLLVSSRIVHISIIKFYACSMKHSFWIDGTWW